VLDLNGVVGRPARSTLTVDGKQKGTSEVKTLIVSAVFAVIAGMPPSIAEVGAKTPGRHSSLMTAKPAQARLSASDESRLSAMIAQHKKLRLRLPEEYRHELDRLTVLMRKHLFAALPRANLLASATQMVRKIISGVTPAEARNLSEYVLGGIASGDAIGATAGGSSQTELLNATKEMQETQMSFNLQYLQLQSQMQHENRSYTAISNIMKTKHETVKNSISNVR
jgi:hypothetical protein